MPRNGVACLAHVALLNDCVRKRSCWAAAGSGDPPTRAAHADARNLPRSGSRSRAVCGHRSPENSLKTLRQKPQQPRRQEARETALFLQGIGHPEMRCEWHDDRAHVKPCLLQRQ
jgi:hypothetical protein